MQAWDIAIFCFLHVPPPRCIHDREMLVCLTFHFATAFLGSGKFSSWSCLARRRFYTKPSLNTAPLCVVRFLWLTWNVCAMLEMITHFLAVSFAVKSLAGPVTRGLATIGVWGGGGKNRFTNGDQPSDSPVNELLRLQSKLCLVQLKIVGRSDSGGAGTWEATAGDVFSVVEVSRAVNEGHYKSQSFVGACRVEASSQAKISKNSQICIQVTCGH